MALRVLIAEDNQIVRDLMRSQIEELAGAEVCTAVANGIEAVEAAITLRPDLLILDVLIPDLNGIQVAGVVKKSLPRAKIILFTLYSDFISPQMINALGARLVSKADGLRALASAVQELIVSRAKEIDEDLAINHRAFDTGDLDSLTRQFSAPLTRCSRDLKFLWVNEHYANFLKRPVNKIVGRSILDILGKSAFDVLQRYFDQVLRGTKVSYEIELEYKSAGRRHIAASYRPTFDTSGSPDGWVAYVREITPHRNLLK